MKLVVKLDTQSINDAITKLNDYSAWLERKCDELVNRLAEHGAHIARAMFFTARYDGNNDVKVSIEQRGENTAAIVAVGEAVLFIEFGSGAMLGYGHPDPMGYGPGTWSDGPNGKGHWDDPKGWWLPKSAGGGKSYGNPPAGAMYAATKEIRLEVERIAREVFSHD